MQVDDELEDISREVHVTVSIQAKLIVQWRGLIWYSWFYSKYLYEIKHPKYNNARNIGIKTF